MSQNQKTLAGKVSFSGKALQTGKDVAVTCVPAGTGAGIVFRRTDMGTTTESRIGDMVFSDAHLRRSTVGAAGAEIQTVEHFLAALWGLELDNLVVEIDGGELPAMDGSAAGFLHVLKAAGTVDQPARRNFIRISDPLTVEEDGSSLTVLPGEGLAVSYFIDYDCVSIGKEEFSIELNKDSFEKEIAPARTFCLKKEAEALLKAGLGGGATFENTLVMDNDGPVGTVLRFPNEPLRHKILDLTGDLYLLGAPLIGRVVARKSGHGLNMKMVKMIHEKYGAGPHWQGEEG